MASNNKGSLIPNLWLCVGINNEGSIQSITAQQITIGVSYRNRISRISGVYAHTNHLQRHQLWLDLTQVHTV